MSPKRRKPSYLLHRPTGQARVRIDGKDHYLGPYGSPESRDRYDDLVAQWCRRNGDLRAYLIPIDELCLLFTEHAKEHYRKENGEPTSEQKNILAPLRLLIRLFGTLRVQEFGPRKLQQVRDAMIEAGWVRTSINRQIDRIKRMFRWGVANEYVSVQVYEALRTVAGLKKGRSAAAESEPVKPVPQPHIDAVQPFVSRQVWAVIQLQLLTGGREGEILTVRVRDLKMQGEIWEYRPESHKTQHHDKDRIILLGPRAQDVIREFLKPNLDAYLFSPHDAVAEYHAKRRANRKTPMTPSQRARRPKENPKWKPRDYYLPERYWRAIARACIKAGVPHWHPHQLRHNAATRIERESGIDAARAVLGHGSINVTKVYTERDLDTARMVIAKIG